MIIDFEKIKAARLKSKLSIEAVASNCSLSVQQIKSIEENKGGGFFNDHFKKIATKKYIAFLNLSEDEIFHINKKDELLEQPIENEPSVGSDDAIKPSLKFFIPKYINYTIILALLFTLFLIIFNKTEDNVSENIIDNELLPEIQEESIPKLESEIPLDIISNNQENKESPNSNTSADINEGTMTQLSDSCESIFNQNENKISNYQTRRVPEKPNNYIHLTSTSKQTICIKSQNKDVKEYEIDGSNPLTFRGSPPFLIYLNPILTEIFFQGWKIPLDNNFNLYQITSYQDPTLSNFQ
jgi:cytoskeletal protein RodZ